MPLTLNPKTMLSRQISYFVSQGKKGAELFESYSGTLTPPRKLNLRRISQTQTDGSIFDAIWKFGKDSIGFIFSSVDFLGWSATTIFSWLVSGIESIKAFNWNASDQELQTTIEGYNTQIASVWGGVVGQGVGWLGAAAVGYGVGLLVPGIGGAVLARTVAGRVLSEGAEELLASVKNAIIATTSAALRTGLITIYINFRKLIRAIPEENLKHIFGEKNGKFIKNQWGEQGQPVLSFNQKMSDAVESLDNKQLQAFVEEALEESWDSFIEGGYIVAHTLDEAIAQSQMNQQQILGTPRTVQIELDRDNDREQLVLQNIPQNLAISTVQSSISNFRLLSNRDVGQIVGQPVEDYVTAKPQTLRLKIHLFSVDSPPWIDPTGNKLTRVTITIPDVKRSALDWEKIKTACGGSNGYNWGRFRAKGSLSTGRPIDVYGATKEEAEQRLDALLALCDSELLSVTVTEETKRGVRLTNKKLQKETTRIYPGYCYLINRQEFLDNTKGSPSKKGNFKDRRARIELWRATPPDDFNQVITTILSHGTL